VYSKLHCVPSENRLEPLLYGLLGMKAENGVCNFGVGGELSQGNCVLRGLAGQEGCELVWLKLLRGLGHPEALRASACLGQSPIAERARH
jgi:hypothetical protein